MSWIKKKLDKKCNALIQTRYPPPEAVIKWKKICSTQVASEVLKMLFGSLREIVGNFQKSLGHEEVKISRIWQKK